MTLYLSSPPWLSRPSPPLPTYTNTNSSYFRLSFTSVNFPKLITTKASSLGESESANGVAEDSASELLDDDLLSKLSGAKDAQEALKMIEELAERKNGGVVSVSDCCSIISAALKRNNPELALSVFYEMRASFDQGVDENGPKWKWSRPDVSVYTTLILGLAASLRVSDALKMINNICRVGVSPAEEVPFGKVVRCPSCMIAVAVAQPQHGIQIASCAKCSYQYELVSGNIDSIASEEIGISSCRTQHGYSSLEKGTKIPADIEAKDTCCCHSVVVQTPSGMARTHRFATETVDLPAQEGERVTIALAAPLSLYRELGPLKLSPKAPNYYPSEPICLTNHEDGRESQLLRAPTKDGGTMLTNPSILFPIVAVLATGNAASGVIDPSLPQFISVAAVTSLAFGVTLKTLVLPQLNRLPQRVVDTVAIKQQLLSQYDTLQSRLKGLKEAAEKEVWMLARMCQLENKIYAVGEPSYRARRSKVKRVREGLENSLKGRIELIDSYARISSMIEIEVELDSDVLAAEQASNVENIAEQIQQTMELENLEERWRIQVEANDEAERLLSSQPLPTEQRKVAEDKRKQVSDAKHVTVKQSNSIEAEPNRGASTLLDAAAAQLTAAACQLKSGGSFTGVGIALRGAGQFMENAGMFATGHALMAAGFSLITFSEVATPTTEGPSQIAGRGAEEHVEISAQELPGPSQIAGRRTEDHVGISAHELPGPSQAAPGVEKSTEPYFDYFPLLLSSSDRSSSDASADGSPSDASADGSPSDASADGSPSDASPSDGPRGEESESGSHSTDMVVGGPKFSFLKSEFEQQ